jgi:hypothetical protein
MPSHPFIEFVDNHELVELTYAGYESIPRIFARDLDVDVSQLIVLDWVVPVDVPGGPPFLGLRWGVVWPGPYGWYRVTEFSRAFSTNLLQQMLPFWREKHGIVRQPHTPPVSGRLQ